MTRVPKALIAILLLTGCAGSIFEESDLGVAPAPPPQPEARCGNWDPSRQAAYLASWAVNESIRTLPPLSGNQTDVWRVIGVSAAYAPGQDVTNNQFDAMLAVHPFCLNDQCDLHFKRNGQVEKAQLASVRGACLSQSTIDAAGSGVLLNADAAELMGLDEANNFSIDGPITNILFVNDIRLTGFDVPAEGNRCSAADIACAFRFAGSALVERSSVIDASGAVIDPGIVKHEIGHLHGLDHPIGMNVNVANLYVGGPVQNETLIPEDRCKHMRTNKPQNYSPWFVALGGTVTSPDDAPNCP